MIKKILGEINEIDNSIMKLMNNGFIFSFAIGILGILFLLTYNTYSVSYDIYQGGFILVKTGLIFAAEILGCGFVVDKLNKNRAL